MTIVIDGTNGISGVDGSAGTPAIQGNDSNTGLWFPAADTVAISTSGSERMRLDSSGNLGIGTSSPAYKLSVSKASAGDVAQFTNGGASNKSLFVYTDATYAAIATSNNASGNGIAFDAVNNQILFTTNSANRAWLDSSGNLGLGVTPNAWGSTYKAIHLGTGGAISGRTVTVDQTAVSANAFHNGTAWTYIGNAASTLYQQAAGVHYWYNAPSGTAGNAITFTQAMTLDASGNLSVTTGNSWAPSGAYAAVLGNSGKDAGLTTYYDDSSVKIGAGVSQQTGILIYGHSHANGNYIAFRAGNNERARITSGGDLLVGTTSNSLSGASRTFALVSPGFAAAFQSTSSTATDEVLCLQQSATTGDNTFIVFKTDGGTGTLRGTITYNRGAGLTAYNTTSDYRAKDIIGPVQNPGATIDALKVYEGVMKGATQSRPMLIAHEAQAHAPYAVSGVKDEVNEDGTPKFQQMDVSSLVPLLLAEIQSLRARLAAAGI